MSGDERYDAERRAKQRLLGNIRLIAELFNKEQVRQMAASDGCHLRCESGGACVLCPPLMWHGHHSGSSAWCPWPCQ